MQHNGDEDHSECKVIISSVGSEAGESGSESGIDSEHTERGERERAGDGELGGASADASAGVSDGGQTPIRTAAASEARADQRARWADMNSDSDSDTALDPAADLDNSVDAGSGGACPGAQRRRARRKTRNAREARQKAAEAAAANIEPIEEEPMRLQEDTVCVRMYAMDTQQGVAGGAMAWRTPVCAPFAEACRRAQVRPYSMPAGRLDRNPQDVLRSAVGCLLRRKPRQREINYGTNDEEGIYQTMVTVHALGRSAIGPERQLRAEAHREAARTAVEALVRRGWVRRL